MITISQVLNERETIARTSLFQESDINAHFGQLYMESIMDKILKVGGETGAALKRIFTGIYEADKKLSNMSSIKEIEDYLNNDYAALFDALVFLAVSLTSMALAGVIPVIMLIIQIWCLIMFKWIAYNRSLDKEPNIKIASNIVDKHIKELNNKKNDKNTSDKELEEINKKIKELEKLKTAITVEETRYVTLWFL